MEGPLRIKPTLTVSRVVLRGELNVRVRCCAAASWAEGRPVKATASGSKPNALRHTIRFRTPFATTTPSCAPSPTPIRRRCHRTPDGGVEAYTVNPDGTSEQLVDVPELIEDFGRPVWSHDGQQLLLSHFVRFDQAGELLPFRPATAQPDGSEFNLLESPELPFDGLCLGGVSTTRRFCAVWVPDQNLQGCSALPPPMGAIRYASRQTRTARRTTRSVIHLTAPRSLSSASDRTAMWPCCSSTLSAPILASSPSSGRTSVTNWRRRRGLQMASS